MIVFALELVIVLAPELVIVLAPELVIVLAPELVIVLAPELVIVLALHVKLLGLCYYFYSAHFTAPEVLSGQSVSMETDMWSLGVVLYTL